MNYNIGKNNSHYIDGRSLKVYYCKIVGCQNKIHIQTALYGKGMCASHAGKYRKHISPTIKHRQKISNTLKKKFKNKKNHPNFGKHLSKNHKRKISKANKGKLKGKDNPFYGKILKPNWCKYKRIWMRSGYEIAFAQFLDLSGIKYKYEPKAFDLSDTTYRPDFYIPEWDLWIEIKGYISDLFKKKFNKFKKKYPNERIKILMQKDLQELGVLN